ncbi:hypothetical protein LMG29739_06308 [Paraburkholderia solisilvae]|uniref:Uncharacterized protein n=1 Tax=Paraburkholderia solisilvae TaxID=624376 RepID=A0A6J5F1C7_9BURK|nr:hypothetical protein LMG29739_06308 [Paraburkholderia solisilvae]
MQAVIAFCEHALRVSAINRIAGKAWVIAKVLATRHAIATATTGAAEPWHAYPLAYADLANAGTQCRNGADNFMAGNQRMLRMLQFAVDDMQISTAYAASPHVQENFPDARFGIRQVPLLQHRIGSIEYHRPHIAPPSQSRRTARSWQADLIVIASPPRKHPGGSARHGGSVDIERRRVEPPGLGTAAVKSRTRNIAAWQLLRAESETRHD